MPTRKPLFSGVSTEAVEKMKERGEVRSLNTEAEENKFGLTAEEFEREQANLRNMSSDKLERKLELIAASIVQSKDDSFIEHLNRLIKLNEQLATYPFYSDSEKEEFKNEAEFYERCVEIIETKKQLLDQNQEFVVAQNSINNILEEQKQNFQKLMSTLGTIDPLKTNDVQEIVNNLKDSLETIPFALRDLQTKIDEYEKSTGKKYDLNINFYSEDLVRQYYQNYALAAKRINDQITSNPNGKYESSLIAMSDKINEAINLLYIVHENPSTVDRIIDEVNNQLGDFDPRNVKATAQTGPTPQPGQSTNNPALEARKQGFKMALMMQYGKIEKLYEDVIVTLNPKQMNLEEQQLQIKQEIQNIFDREIVLTRSIKAEIENEIAADILKRREEFYGKSGSRLISANPFVDLIEFICKIEEHNINDEHFEKDMAEFTEILNIVQNIGLSLDIKADFDETTGILKIDFPDGIIKDKDVSRCIYSPSLIEAMKTGYQSPEQTQTKGSPSPESTGSNLIPESEEEKQNFKSKLLELKGRVLNRYAECIKHLVISPAYINTMVEIQNLFDAKNNGYNLSQETVDNIEREVGIFQTITDTYGPGFDGFIKSVMRYYEEVDITCTFDKEYGTQEFADSYVNLSTSIEEFINNVKNIPNCNEFINEIKFDRNTETLTINYKNSNIPPFNVRIVNQKTFDILHPTAQASKGTDIPVTPPVGPNGPVSGTTEPNPVPTSQPNNEKEKDIEKYIAMVDRYNDLVAELNRINSVIESTYGSDYLTDEVIRSAIDAEKDARIIDNDLKNIRLQLSDYRFEYFEKYNEYITQSDRIKDNRQNMIRFSGSLEEFIEQQDRLIVETELKIVEFDKQRGHGDQAKDQELTAKINNLVEFIESRNSLVGRRLVEEAQINKINIIEILNARRANKTKLREEMANKKDQTQTIQQSPIQPEKQNQTQTIIGNKPEDEPDESKSAPQPDPIVTVPQAKVVRLELKLKKDKIPKIDRANATVAEQLQPLTCQIVKNKLKIQFSAQLKEKLKDLSAKVSLVNKQNYRKRTSVKLDPDADEVEIGFADGREINPDDYRIEFRSQLENGKGTKVDLYGDLEEEVSHKL